MRSRVPHVLITGAEGSVGRAIWDRLTNRYELRALTRRATPISSHVADIAELDAIRPAFDGADAVVHLAATADIRSPWERILPSNLIGVRNVFEAAARSSVRRVVFASSVHALGMYVEDRIPWREDPELPAELPIELVPRPDSLYGASKAWGEALGRWYADRGGLSVVCLRIGWLTAKGPPSPRRPDADPAEVARASTWRAAWLGHDDCASLVAAAIDAPPSLRWAVVYGVSDNPGRWLSLEAGRQELGWEPRESVADYP